MGIHTGNTYHVYCNSYMEGFRPYIILSLCLLVGFFFAYTIDALYVQGAGYDTILAKFCK
jgi:hypothetical protein